MPHYDRMVVLPEAQFKDLQQATSAARSAAVFHDSVAGNVDGQVNHFELGENGRVTIKPNGGVTASTAGATKKPRPGPHLPPPQPPPPPPPPSPPAKRAAPPSSPPPSSPSSSLPPPKRKRTAEPAPSTISSFAETDRGEEEGGEEEEEEERTANNHGLDAIRRMYFGDPVAAPETASSSTAAQTDPATRSQGMQAGPDPVPRVSRGSQVQPESVGTQTAAVPYWTAARSVDAPSQTEPVVAPFAPPTVLALSRAVQSERGYDDDDDGGDVDADGAGDDQPLVEFPSEPEVQQPQPYPPPRQPSPFLALPAPGDAAADVPMHRDRGAEPSERATTAAAARRMHRGSAKPPPRRTPQLTPRNEQAQTDPASTLQGLIQERVASLSGVDAVRIPILRRRPPVQTRATIRRSRGRKGQSDIRFLDPATPAQSAAVAPAAAAAAEEGGDQWDDVLNRVVSERVASLRGKQSRRGTVGKNAKKKKKKKNNNKKALFGKRSKQQQRRGKKRARESSDESDDDDDDELAGYSSSSDDEPPEKRRGVRARAVKANVLT